MFHTNGTPPGTIYLFLLEFKTYLSAWQRVFGICVIVNENPESAELMKRYETLTYDSTS